MRRPSLSANMPETASRQQETLLAMSKSKRARRRQKLAQRAARQSRQRESSDAPRKRETLAPAVHVFPNPFESLSDDQRRRAIEEIAANSELKYQEALSDLRTILRRHDPLLVLSIVSFYGLTAPVDNTAGITKLDSDCEIYPFHVEILQALSLQVEPADLSRAPFGPDVSTQIWETVQTLCSAHTFRGFDRDGVDLSDNDKTVALAQQLMRWATQSVRNWGYHSQIKRIARELYGPFDSPLTEARGFSASNVIDVFEAIVDEVESRQTARLQTLADLFRSSGADRRLLVENYHELIGLKEAEAERFIESLNVEQTHLELVRSMVLSHYDLFLSDLFHGTSRKPLI